MIKYLDIVINILKDTYVLLIFERKHILNF